MSVPVALTVASSDSGGGAGIQADLKAFARCGVYGASVVAALTAQDTTAVHAVHACPPGFVAAQLDAVLADLRPAAVKTGMLATAEAVEVVADRVAGLPLVVDPVLVASSGAVLLAPDAVEVMLGRLFPLASVVTPNLPEAQALTGLATGDRRLLAEALADLGARAALVTGGHGEPIDHLFTGTRHVRIPVPRYATPATHGSGCTHSAALAAALARGDDLETAARRAAAVAAEAVRQGLAGIGAGAGPVDAIGLAGRRPPEPIGGVSGPQPARPSGSFG